MYQLGDARTLTTKTEEGELAVILKDVNKCIEMSAIRWTSFLLLFNDIEKAQLLRDKQPVNFFEHFGGGWYVSVATDSPCVDIHRFYKNGGVIKPSCHGLALHLKEWSDLCIIAPRLMFDVPDLAFILPGCCSYGPQNPQCPECCPFE